MPAVTTIYITHESGSAAASIAEKLVDNTGDPRRGLAGIARFIDALAGGMYNGKVVVQTETATNTAPATSTITLTHANITNNDTLTIGPQLLTWKTSAANQNEITIGANATADATALAAVINAHTTLKGLVSAVASSGTVILTAIAPGNGGRFTLSTSDGTAMSFSAATMAFGSGSSSLASGAGPVTYRAGV